VALSLQSLAVVLRAQQRWQEAAEVLAACVATREKLLSTDSPQLASAYHQQVRGWAHAGGVGEQLGVGCSLLVLPTLQAAWGTCTCSEASHGLAELAVNITGSSSAPLLHHQPSPSHTVSMPRHRPCCCWTWATRQTRSAWRAEP
jgi:hypothetical protein